MHTLIVDDEPLARDELGYLLKKCPEITALHEAESIDETLSILIEHRIELIFLDIHLTEESGLSLAEKLRQLKNPPMVIFATAFDEHAIQAFELDAVDYVLKPFSFERIQQAVRKAEQQFQSHKIDKMPANGQSSAIDTIPLQTKDRIVLVKIDSIVAVSVNKGETSLYTDEEEHPIHGTLNAWEEKLKEYPSFLRVHRSFLINSHKIKEIQPWFNHTYQLTMENHLKVPVSRFYMNDFKEKIGI